MAANRGIGVRACFVSAVAWTYVSAALSGGDPHPVAACFACAALSFELGRFMGRRSAAIVPGAVTALGLASALFFVGDLPSRRPLSGPLRYENASAALYLQTFIGALALRSSVRRLPGRVVASLAAASLFCVTLLAGSRAVTALTLLPAAALCCRSERESKLAVRVLGALVPLALIVSIASGVSYGSDGPFERVVALTLGETRAALWRDGLLILISHPWSGTGPGEFSNASALAGSDPDIRWAHNGFLQQGAEGGLPALLLLSMIFCGGFVTLYRARAPGLSRVLAAVSLGALGTHACVDYVLHFPALSMIAAALVGSACVPPVRGKEAGSQFPAPDRSGLSSAGT